MSGFLQKPGGGGSFDGVTVDGTTIVGDGLNTPLSAIFNQQGKYMVSGGAIWSGTGLTYDVSFLNYFFNGNKTANPTQVTLDASDPTNNRFDAIVVDEAGTVTTITGTPSANPEVPAIPEDQLQVTIILVAAGSTTPTIASEEIYMDDPTTGWTFSTYDAASPATGTINFAGTSSPKQGTECIEASTDLRRGARFVRGTSFDAFQYTMLQVWVRFTGTAVASNKSLNVRFENSAGTLVANTVNLFNYGLQRGVLNTWQLVVVPISAFGALPATVKGLKMIMAGGTVGSVRQWDIDYMILTNGSVPFANVPTIAFYKDNVGIAAQSGLNIKQGTGMTITAVNNPSTQSVDYTFSASGGSSITEGAPTQADRASVDIQVLDNDYESINGLQITFGTSPNEQVLEFYDSDTDPVPTAPIIGIDIGGGTYRKASDFLVGPGSVIKDLITYSSLTGTFSDGEQVRQVIQTGQWFGSDPNGDARTIVYNTSGDFVAGYIGNDTLQTSTGGKDSDITLATITYSGLSGTFQQYEAVSFGGGKIGVVYYDNGSNEMKVWLTSGTPIVTDPITGEYSGATATIATISTYAGQFIIDFSYSTGFTLGDPIQNFDTYSTVYSDNGVDTMYTDVGGSFTVSGDLYGTTSNATATVDTFTQDVYFNSIVDGDTVTIGGKTYTWQSTLTNVDGNVQLGTDDADSLSNLSLALQLTGTPGTDYAASMNANAFVSSDGSSSTSLDVIALIPGTTGNSIAVSQSIASGEYDWNNPTLDGGSDPIVELVARQIDQFIRTHNVSGIASRDIIADDKVLSSDVSTDTVTVFSIRPGTYGNGIAVDSTDNTTINPSASTFTGGADNGTTGVIGSLRKGVVITGTNNSSVYNDCIFQAIDNNVWIIISSSNALTNGYEWSSI